MDAMDVPRGRQKMGKKEKAKYAAAMRMQELMLPPKNPPPAWMDDPSLLPKKPPGRR